MTNDPEVLVRFLKDAREVRNQLWTIEPGPSTRAETDIRTARDALGSEEPGRRIYELANTWLMTASEAIRGIGVLIDDRESWPAMFPLMRSVIENCGAVLWLTDQSSFELRACRAAVAFLTSRERNLLFSGKFDKQSAEYRATKMQRDEAVALVTDEFETVERDPWSVRQVIMPSPSFFVHPIAERRSEGKIWEGIYAYLSGMGIHPSGGLGSIMNQVGPGHAQIALSDIMLGSLLRATVDPFLLALGNVSGSLGWSRPIFDEYHRRYVEVLSS